MRSSSLHVFFILGATFASGIANAQQPSDADLDAEGQVAMSQFHDCARARSAFERESVSAQGAPTWLDEVARAAECAGDLAGALNYYERELKKLPDTPRLVQKVGELRYKLEVQADQARVQQAAAAEFQRQQQQQNEMQAEAQNVHEAAKSEARGRLASNLNSLNQLLSGTFTDNAAIGQVKRDVQSSADCKLIVHEDVRSSGGSKCKYTRHIEVPLNEQLTISLESGRWINVVLPQADVKWQEVGVHSGGPFSDCHYNDRNDNSDQRNVEFLLQDASQVNAVISLLKDVSLACAP